MNKKLGTRGLISIIISLILLFACSKEKNYKLNSFIISFPNEFSLVKIENEYFVNNELNYIKDHVTLGDENKNLYIDIVEYDIDNKESNTYNYELEDLIRIIKNDYQLKHKDEVYRVFESDDRVILSASNKDRIGVHNYSMAYYKNNRLQRIEVQINEEDYNKYKSVIVEFLKGYEMNHHN